MLPKIAGLFGKASRPKAPIDVEEMIASNIDIDGNTQDDKFDQLLAKQVKISENKPKYIIAAIEKAEERRELAENVKQLKLEREIEQLEKDQIVLRFNTDDINNVTEEIVQNTPESNEIKLDNENQEEEEKYNIESMRQRYFQRMEEKDILKMNLSKQEIVRILNWGKNDDASG